MSTNSSVMQNSNQDSPNCNNVKVSGFTVAASETTVCGLNQFYWKNGCSRKDSREPGLSLLSLQFYPGSFCHSIDYFDYSNLCMVMNREYSAGGSRFPILYVHSSVPAEKLRGIALCLNFSNIIISAILRRKSFTIASPCKKTLNFSSAEQ